MSKTETYDKNRRLYFLDNLRTFIIFLVILYHAGGVYESTGMWASFWIVDDAATNNLVGIFNLIFDIFIMPTMFFISGFLTPLSLERKGAGMFLTMRFRRLMIPWVLAVLTLIPLYKVIYLASRGLPQEHWTTYFHFSSGNITSQSWLWFLPVLFLFNLLFVLLTKVNLVPKDFSFRIAIFAVMVIGFATTYAMDMLNLRGWTLTPLIDFQNERLLLYFMVFLLGSLAFHKQIFTSKATNRRLYTIVNAVAWVPVTAYIVFLVFPLFSQGSFILSRVFDKFIVWLSFYLALLANMYLFIETFRRYLDKTGNLWHELNQNAYYVYIIHMIVLGACALLLLKIATPSLVKYIILTMATFFISNLMVSVYRRLTVPRNAAKQMTNASRPSPPLPSPPLPSPHHRRGPEV